MDIARHKDTLEHVYADELWYTKNVDQNNYICIGCILKATPCSHNRNKNKKRPYFRFDYPDDHNLNCFYEQHLSLTEKAKKRSISGKDGFPLPYPSSLNLVDKRVIDLDTKKNQSQKFEVSKSRGSRLSGGSNGVHNYSVKTIASIAKYYLEYWYDRRRLTLNINGIKGFFYDEVIKLLPNEVVEFQAKKIRYGRLNNYKNMKVTNTSIIVSLQNGDWFNGKPDNCFRVVINTEGWKQSKKDYVINCVKASQEEYI